MTNDIKNPARRGGKQGGFIQLIIIVIVALLIMNYFGLTVTKVLAYFGTSTAEIGQWIKNAFTNVLR